MSVATPVQDIVQLAIETTGRSGSVAVLRGEEVLEQTNLAPNQRTAATLAPQVEQMLNHCEKQGIEIALLSIADGPGSFTGLRIGVTTAKTLGFALHLPLVAVDSLAAIAAAAFQANPRAHSICVALDAYRGQIFSGTFDRAELLPQLNHVPNDWTAHPACVEVLSGERWQQRLARLLPELRFAGDRKAFGKLADQTIDRSCDAIGVGLLALRAWQIGQRTDPLALVPRYLKPSAAEEKALDGS